MTSSRQWPEFTGHSGSSISSGTSAAAPDGYPRAPIAADASTTRSIHWVRWTVSYRPRSRGSQNTGSIGETHARTVSAVDEPDPTTAHRARSVRSDDATSRVTSSRVLPRAQW
ncbi:hypothetical protein [Actinomadura sp. 7K507]|uniref:hypothetical protein n=1 Tax=Actinomadura sp. 7K507 TaxID=2530365 RepID=UPI001404D937|nr:hypothetical protein [Actinomadura sp. 7K507]